MANPSQPSGTYDDPKGAGTNSKPQRVKHNPMRLYLWSLFRLVITVLLLGGAAGILKGFEAKDALTKREKYVFNTSIIMLTLLLGINLTIAHSQVVYYIREGIIKRRSSDPTYWRFRHLPKFKDITGLRSSLAFLISLWSPKTPPYHGGVGAASVFISVWFFFNLAVAVIIALIGLTYSLDDGGIGHRNGNISIANTEWFFLDRKSDEAPDIFSQRFVSRLYTDISLSYIDTTPQKPGPDDDYDLEQLPDGWRYNFRQSDPSRKILTRSNRYIKATATCSAFRILSYDFQNTSDMVYDLGNGYTQTIPEMLVGEGTTYISHVENTDDYSSDIVNCGPRCGDLWVTQIGNVSDLHDTWVYFCNSTVHEVEHADIQGEFLGDSMALIAATSLSQSGYYDYLGGLYGHYPDNVYLGTFAKGDPEVIANLVSRGSAGCIAALDQMNPRVFVLGIEPWVGVKLRVRWIRLIIVLVVIFLLQLTVPMCAILWHHINSSGVEPQTTLLDPLMYNYEGPAPHTKGF